MFESDDFDQVLSQFDFPGVETDEQEKEKNTNLGGDSNNVSSVIVVPFSDIKQIIDRTDAASPLLNNFQPAFTKVRSRSLIKKDVNIIHGQNKENSIQGSKSPIFVTPKHTKRKIIDSYFDHQSKRKFPGPAGLLTGALEQPKDDSICQIELLSQDVDFTQHNLQRDLFESPIWSRLTLDAQSDKLEIDSIKTIKQQALSGNLRRRKAQNVTAFVEAVDRSVTDPLIILRDSTGSIKCTLHRDAWSTFSAYIVSEYCALILHKPTVLTTGGAFKKHYLNITLSNILAIYSRNILNEDGSRNMPDGYSLVQEEELTVIKADKCSDSLGTSLEQTNGAEDLVDGLDSFFSDDLF